MEWRSKNYQSDFISNGECEKGWVSWKVIFFLFVSLSVCGAGDVYLQFPYGLSNWQCVGKSKCECNFEWQPKGCEAVNTQHDSGCSWVLLQSCTAIEMGPSMSKKKKKRRWRRRAVPCRHRHSQAESGREVIWRLLFFWPRSHTTKFHLDDAPSDIPVQGRR